MKKYIVAIAALTALSGLVLGYNGEFDSHIHEDKYEKQDMYDKQAIEKSGKDYTYYKKEKVEKKIGEIKKPEKPVRPEKPDIKHKEIERPEKPAKPERPEIKKKELVKPDKPEKKYRKDKKPEEDIEDPEETLFGELSFNDQNLSDNGTVLVEEVTTNQDSTIVITYETDEGLVIAGLASADNLENDTVEVLIEDVGGFPGEHTAHVIATEELSTNYVIGDTVSESTADSVLDFETALVSETVTEDEEVSVQLSFSDQILSENGTVTVQDVTSGQESVVVITYETEEDLVIAGLASANNLEDENIEILIEDAGGFPGEHTAHLIAVEDLSTEYSIGDTVSEDTAENVIDQESALVTEAEPEQPQEFTGELEFNDQNLTENETVLVENVSTGQNSVVIITYETDEGLVVAGLSAADNVTSVDLEIEIMDASGYPGEHTAHVVAIDNLSSDYAIEDLVSEETALEILDSETANIN